MASQHIRPEDPGKQQTGLQAAAQAASEGLAGGIGALQRCYNADRHLILCTTAESRKRDSSACRR